MNGFLLEACRIQLNWHVYLCSQKYPPRNKGLERPDHGEVGFHPTKINTVLQLSSWFLLAVCHLGVIVWTLQNPIMTRVACVDMSFVAKPLYSNREVLAQRFYSPDVLPPSEQSPAGYRYGSPPLLNRNHYQQMLDYSWCYIGLPDPTPLRSSSMTSWNNNTSRSQVLLGVTGPSTPIPLCEPLRTRLA